MIVGLNKYARFKFEALLPHNLVSRPMGLRFSMEDEMSKSSIVLNNTNSVAGAHAAAALGQLGLREIVYRQTEFRSGAHNLEEGEIGVTVIYGKGIARVEVIMIPLDHEGTQLDLTIWENHPEVHLELVELRVYFPYADQGIGFVLGDKKQSPYNLMILPFAQGPLILPSFQGDVFDTEAIRVMEDHLWISGQIFRGVSRVVEKIDFRVPKTLVISRLVNYVNYGFVLVDVGNEDSHPMGYLSDTHTVVSAFFPRPRPLK